MVLRASIAHALRYLQTCMHEAMQWLVQVEKEGSDDNGDDGIILFAASFSTTFSSSSSPTLSLCYTDTAVLSGNLRVDAWHGLTVMAAPPHWDAAREWKGGEGAACKARHGRTNEARMG